MITNVGRTICRTNGKPNNKHPIICLHGMWGSAGTFASLLGVLDKQAIAPDLIGHGNDIRPLKGLGTETCLEQVVELIRAIGASVNIIGHSYGALLAQLVAIRHPELVASVMLFASSPHGNIALPYWRRFSWQTQRRLMKPRYVWAMATSQEFRLTPSDADFVRGEPEIELGPESGRILRELVFGKIKLPNPISRRIPVLVVMGEQDQILPADVGYAIREFHGARIWITSGRHCHIAEKNSTIGNLVWEWLGR